MRCIAVACALMVSALLFFGSVAAAELGVTEAPLTQLEEVVVSGEQPGPGMWRVQQGDHTLYVLGVLSELPKRMRWKSDEVEAVIASAQVVIDRPKVSASSGLGTFRTMLLIPAALRVRSNPDDKLLADVLPEALYQRWLPMREKYLRGSKKYEKRRPVFAASELFQKAISKSKLERSARVYEVIEKAAKRSKVPRVSPTVTIKVEDPKGMLKELSSTSLQDVECFERTLDRLEIELEVMRARADAWAIGDLEALRELPDMNQVRTCIEAVIGASALQSRGFDNIEQRVRDSWLEAAEQALGEHAISFAVLPMRDLLGERSLLSALRERGYSVIEPE